MSDLTYREAILSGAATWYVDPPPLVFLVAASASTARRGGSALVHIPTSFVFGGLWTLIRWFNSASSSGSTRSRSTSARRDRAPVSLVPVYWILVGLHEAWRNYRRFTQGELRASSSARLAQAQLEVLKGQLHPHFLFNTLHAISTLIHRDPDAADEMLAQLSDLLRMTLATVGVQEVPLQQELEFLRRYLDIQQSASPTVSG